MITNSSTTCTTCGQLGRHADACHMTHAIRTLALAFHRQGVAPSVAARQIITVMDTPDAALQRWAAGVVTDAYGIDPMAGVR